MANADGVQLPWLSSFLAVVDHGTFTAAARAVHRAQPRVSAHVAALEDAVGVRLLDRGPRGATATEAGTRFLPHARAALAEVRAGMDSVESLAGELQGTVIVGSFPGASGVLLAPLIKRFREEHAGVSVELHEGGPVWLEGAVANADLDLSIRSADIPQRHPNVVSRHLFDERIVLVTPPDHALARAASVDLRELAGQSLVVTGAPAEGWTDFAERLADAGVAPSRTVNVAHPTTVIALVRAGLGVGLLGEMAAAITAFGDVVTREVPGEEWRRGIGAYWNSRRQLSTAAAAFLVALSADSAP
jgi:DNA-binding transcriptional LysR family regulator